MAFGHLSDTLPLSHGVPAGPLDRSGPASVGLAHLVGVDTDAMTPRVLEPVLTLSELAARFSVSVQTLYGLRSRGRDRCGFRVGRELRFPRAWRLGPRPRSLCGLLGRSARRSGPRRGLRTGARWERVRYTVLPAGATRRAMLREPGRSTRGCRGTSSDVRFRYGHAGWAHRRVRARRVDRCLLDTGGAPLRLGADVVPERSWRLLGTPFSITFGLALCLGLLGVVLAVAGVAATRRPELRVVRSRRSNLCFSLVALAFLGLSYLDLDTAFDDAQLPTLHEVLERLNARVGAQ